LETRAKGKGVAQMLNLETGTRSQVVNWGKGICKMAEKVGNTRGGVKAGDGRSKRTGCKKRRAKDPEAFWALSWKRINLFFLLLPGQTGL